MRAYLPIPPIIRASAVVSSPHPLLQICFLEENYAGAGDTRASLALIIRPAPGKFVYPSNYFTRIVAFGTS